jgi:anti-sigma regulatory factor (Ser/Thr protein kinase)
MSEMLDVELPRDPGAAALARRLVQKHFSALETAQLRTLKLLVSELVNNAVVHGRGRIALRGLLARGAARIEVSDEGSGFHRSTAQSRFEDESGRGLLIVAAESSRWGVELGPTSVWFELDLASVA